MIWRNHRWRSSRRRRGGRYGQVFKTYCSLVSSQASTYNDPTISSAAHSNMLAQSMNRNAVRSASARNTVVRAGRSGIKPVGIATVAAPIITFAAPAFADEAYPETVDSLIGALTAGIKVSAGIVKTGVTIMEAGVDVAKKGYEIAAPVVSSSVTKGIALATPMVKQGVDSAVDKVTPFISNSISSVSTTLSSAVIGCISCSDHACIPQRDSTFGLRDVKLAGNGNQ
eukprot:gene20146-26879_t